MAHIRTSSQQVPTVATVICVDAMHGDDLGGDGTTKHPYQSDWWARFCHGDGPIYAQVHLNPEPVPPTSQHDVLSVTGKALSARPATTGLAAVDLYLRGLLAPRPHHRAA